MINCDDCTNKTEVRDGLWMCNKDGVIITEANKKMGRWCDGNTGNKNNKEEPPTGHA